MWTAILRFMKAMFNIPLVLLIIMIGLLSWATTTYISQEERISSYEAKISVAVEERSTAERERVYAIKYRNYVSSGEYAEILLRDLTGATADNEIKLVN